MRLWIVTATMLAATAALAFAVQTAPTGLPTPTAMPAEGLEPSPLAFVPNRGQTDARVRYRAEAGGFGAYFTNDGITLDLRRGEQGAALQLRFVGAGDAAIVPEGRMPGRVNYLGGSRSQTNLPTYAGVRYRALWPGIDMAIRGQGGKLKYEFVMRPGANPADIRLAYRGAEGLAVGAAGALTVATPLGPLRDSRPDAYQRVGDARETVASSYAVAGHGYGFDVGVYDRSRPLVIDPGLSYSTFLGGLGSETSTKTVAGPDGSAYVAGTRTTSDFPTTPGAYDTTSDPSSGYVTKFNPAGSGLVYSTYLPRDSFNFPDLNRTRPLAVDDAGSAYVGGGNNAAVIAKLNPSGSGLDYMRTLDGSLGVEGVSAISIDGAGNAYAAGTTNAPNFPTTAGAFDETYQGCRPSGLCPTDAFLAKLDPDGNVVFSTFLGGDGHDRGTGITVDDTGHVYATGIAASYDFPTTPGAYDRTYAGCNPGCANDGYVAKLTPDGSSLVFSTFAPPTLDGGRIAVDSQLDVYVAAGFLVKLNAAGSALLYSKPVPGSTVIDVDLDEAGHAYVTGGANASFAPTFGAFDRTFNDSECCRGDAFVAKVDSSGREILYASYLGGSGTDRGTSIEVRDGAVYVAGRTEALNFPTTQGAFDQTWNGGFSDAFVAKLVLPDAYPRPKGASPLRAALTLAYERCTSPDREHGPPLAFGSCGSPQQTSQYLTLGTPDANGKPVKSLGHVRIGSIAGNPSTPPDEADMALDLFVNDVRRLSDLEDYTGELLVSVQAKITDRQSGTNEDGLPGAGTTEALSFEFPAQCVGTANTEGADCSVSTTADAIVAGTISEGKRSIWELGQVRVYDGGADGDAQTADNTLFEAQGLFIP